MTTGIARAEDFLARFDRQERAKCDPKRGWERGPGGKCVRAKPLSQNAKTALVGGASFAGGGLLVGAIVLARQAGASKQKAADLNSQSAANAEAIAKSDQGLQRLEQKLLPAAKGQPFNPPKDSPPKPPDRTLELERGLDEAQKENRDLKAEQKGLRSQVSESERTIAAQQKSLRAARQELDNLGTTHQQQVAQAGELQKTIAQQEKALAAIAKDLERKSAKLERANAKLQEGDEVRSRAVLQQRATSLENDRLKTRQSDLEEELTNTNSRLKRTSENLAQARSELEATTKTLGKTQKDLSRARDRVKSLEDALLVVPIGHPSALGRKREKIDPDVLDQQPKGSDKRKRHVDLSIENAKRHLARLRGEPDPSRRSLLKTPIDALKNQQGEIDPERVDIAKRAFGAARRKFQESQAEPIEPANPQEARGVIESVIKGRIKEKQRAAVPRAIEIAIPGPNGKRLADLYRFGKADAGLANKVETWSQEMEAAMKNPDPVTRREWMKQFSEKLAKETFSTQSNQDKVMEAIDETGEAIADRYAGRGRIGGEKVKRERSLLDQVFSPEFEAGGRSRRLPKGTRAVKKTWLERLATPGQSRYKEVADVKRRRSALAKLVRGLLDLQNDRLDSDQLDSRSLAQILRCDSATSSQIIQGDRPLNAREIGTLRAIYGLPAIFDPDDHLSTQILLSGIRQDARTCKAPWKGVLGKCRREDPGDRPPPNPGRRAAKATLLAGGLVGAGLLGVAAYGASRPMPPRPAPPDIGPGRPRPPAPTPAKGAKTPPVKPPATPPAGSPIANDDLFNPKSRAVIDQAWQSLQNKPGSVSDPVQTLRDAGQGGKENRSNAYNRFKAGFIAKNLGYREQGESVWGAIIEEKRAQQGKPQEDGKRKKGSSDPLGTETLMAVSIIGGDTDARVALQVDFWNRIKDKNQLFGGVKGVGGKPSRAPFLKAGWTDPINSLAREVKFAAEQNPDFKLTDAWMQKQARAAYIDSSIETELRSPAAIRRNASTGFSPEVWEKTAKTQDASVLAKYPFLRTSDYQGATSSKETFGSKLSPVSYGALSTWQDMKYSEDRNDPYHVATRELLNRAANINADAASRLTDNRLRADFHEDAIFLVSARMAGKNFVDVENEYRSRIAARNQRRSGS